VPTKVGGIAVLLASLAVVEMVSASAIRAKTAIDAGLHAGGAATILLLLGLL